MPDDDAEALQRARQDEREGKAPTTQAGEFIREEMHHIREGKHGASSPQQAIAIGLSKARRAGIAVPARGKSASKSRSGRTSSRRQKPSARRSRATTSALKRKGRGAASPKALSRQGRAAAGRRTAGQRSASAKKAAQTRARAR